MTRLGEEADEAEQEIRDIVYDVAKDLTLISFFELITSGSVEQAMNWLKKRIKRPLDWVTIAQDAWIIYNNMKKIENLETESKDDYDEWQKWVEARDAIQDKAAEEPYSCKIYGWYKGD
ncbi:MAG: hypothetical protein ACNI26_15125 [Terasakiella sp.]|uniref:hypothetical protein n=1 Tax=unclassified Terasakiella TaxID=2614952 RepID=UPI003B0022C5